MIFKSSEIRWFSKQKSVLWNFYVNLPEKGEGAREEERTDYYLESQTIQTGIKIREGNHELKVKRADDEKLDMGVMEHWTKWSTSEEKNILNTIDEQLLGDWIAVEKKRFKKSYEIINQENIEFLHGEFVDEGCGIEFTEITLDSSDSPIFTVGLEAFSAEKRQRENLLDAIRILDLDLSLFKELDSFGYPQMLLKY